MTWTPTPRQEEQLRRLDKLSREIEKLRTKERTLTREREELLSVMGDIPVSQVTSLRRGGKNR